MSLLFDDGTPDYLSASTAVVTAIPFTVSCWFYSDDLTILQTLLWVGDKDVGDHFSALSLQGNVAGDPLRAFKHQYGGDSTNAQTANSYSANTWQHACGIWAAVDDTRSYLNGDVANKGSDATSQAVSDHDSTSIGYAIDDSPGQPMSGRIAEMAVWNVGLTEAEVLELAAGYSPAFVRPQSLILYRPMVRDADVDLIGGLSFTATGAPTVAVHPRMIYPASKHYSFAASVVSPGQDLTWQVGGMQVPPEEQIEVLAY